MLGRCIVFQPKQAVAAFAHSRTRMRSAAHIVVPRIRPAQALLYLGVRAREDLTTLIGQRLQGFGLVNGRDAVHDPG
jgi:hypothetical protein